MRLTAIDGFSLVGFSFSEVIEKLRHAPRPLRITFADLTSGLKVRPDLIEQHHIVDQPVV